MYGSCNAAKIDLKHHDLAAVKQNPEQDLGVKGDPLTVSVLAVFVHLSEFRNLFSGVAQESRGSGQCDSPGCQKYPKSPGQTSHSQGLCAAM